MNTIEKIRESNRIESILREPTAEEVAEHERFMLLKRLTVEDLEQFIGVYQPYARLRLSSGDNVRVGNYFPPRGGPKIRQDLESLLVEINAHSITPWQAHVRYEKLHPFTDGNGRSGRAIWYWMMP